MNSTNSRALRARRRVGAVAVAVGLVAALASGCTQTGDSSADASHSTHAIPAPFTPANDLQFIDGMVPHHDMATRMADHALMHGASATVRAMAQRMKDMQSREIATMRTARQALAGAAESPPHDDPRMAADMTRLMAASGAALDAMFLEQMIPHHAGGIQMAYRALPNLRRPELRALATGIVDSQAREIGEMQAMRTPSGN